MLEVIAIFMENTVNSLQPQPRAERNEKVGVTEFGQAELIKAMKSRACRAVGCTEA